MVSWAAERNKRAGLHYIAVFENPGCKHGTCSCPRPQNRQNRCSRDELGLAEAEWPCKICKRRLLHGFAYKFWGAGHKAIFKGAQDHMQNMQTPCPPLPDLIVRFWEGGPL